MTTVIRALALKQVTNRDVVRVVLKEAGAGCMMGELEKRATRTRSWQRPGGRPGRREACVPVIQICSEWGARPKTVGAVLGLVILGFSCIWSGISTQVGATVAISLPVRGWRASSTTVHSAAESRRGGAGVHGRLAAGTHLQINRQPRFPRTNAAGFVVGKRSGCLPHAAR